MTNPSGKKGTTEETRVVKWFRENGFGAADRLTKTGSHDRGDVLLCPGLMAEVKAVKTAGRRGPTPAQLVDFMAQTAVETTNGGHDLGILVVKREGTQDVGRWWAFVTVRDLVTLVGAYRLPYQDPLLELPVSMTVADLTLLLREGGWGDQP